MAYPVIPSDDDKAYMARMIKVGWDLPENAKWRKRVTMERMIVRKVCRDAIAAGCTVSVYYGDGEYGVKKSTDLHAIMADIGACDMEWLNIHRDGKFLGQIALVYGNDGHDVLCDYHTSLEETLKGANELADKLQS